MNRLLGALMGAFLFSATAIAQDGPQEIVGMFCDTADQVAAVIDLRNKTRNEDDRAVVKQVEGCGLLAAVGVVGDTVGTLYDDLTKHALEVKEVLVLGVVIGQTLRQLPAPTTQYIVHESADRGA